ncbi:MULTISPECIES: tryptophan synthase subunit beta [Cysteiniphilum]|uniref:Tryptophan synthase beta chain n=1 Tax=Cysteiniphilum litorale TaxID=2056700 RepID=A0A8J3E6B5_9GAMM|nr:MULTISPECIES: tryptophan synthase subunit beta [Cysteiniphilum]GGF88374.1 tryptophan synthase subunit beta [Cysteiniphilum litorale]
MQLNTRYGQFGGCYAPESLMPILTEIERGFIAIEQDESFQLEFKRLLKDYAGRETPITYIQNLSNKYGANIYLKREDLLHGGAHKTNNTIGQMLLAKYLGKKRVIAETGAGQHGVATAMTGAMLGLQVEIYMGAVDIARQKPNVERMKLFGAKVHSVSSGSATLKDAINDAMRDWITNAEDTYYCFGTAAGPHPFPALVRYFQEIIGKEARAQMLKLTRALPDAVIACVGGGSNAIGIFSGFLSDEKVAIYGAEPAGKGLETGEHAATMNKGEIGVFHGMQSLFLQDKDGQIKEPYSISAGLDYPGIGPEHVYLQESKRVSYLTITDDEAIAAFEELSKKEGIIPAFESAHALALAFQLAQSQLKGKTILVNLSGRGDKDLQSYFRYKGLSDE